MTISNADLVDAVFIRPLGPSDSIWELTAFLHRSYARLANLGLRYKPTDQSEEVTRARIERGEFFVRTGGHNVFTASSLPVG